MNLKVLLKIKGEKCDFFPIHQFTLSPKYIRIRPYKTLKGEINHENFIITERKI